LDENLAATDSEREIFQEVRKSITSDLAADSLSDSEEADRDSVATDAEVNTLFEPIGGDLSSQGVVPETDYDRVMNDSDDELSGEASHTEDCISEFNLLESSDVLQVAIGRSRKLKDHEKYNLITSSQNVDNTDLDTVYFMVSGGRKRKQISFQKRWLQDYKWLCYGLGENQGGWCLPCILFLTDDEKANLGAFVCTPFKNYNKSKELMEKHAKHAYHTRAVNSAFEFTRRWVNPESRIESHIIDKNSRNFKSNSEVLPTIVEAVLLCAKQRIALQGHHQDKIDFTEEA